jgi:hypothetical protein
MDLLDRIRSFWRRRPPDDHPLTERERHEDRTSSAYDERDRTADEFVHPDLDPDEPRSGRLD